MKSRLFANRLLLKSFSIVGSWTLVSRFFGFLRDILMANFLGSGIIAESFLIAFSIPNMFRRLFAEGAFNTAFLPMFSKRLNNKLVAERFASDALSLLILSLLLLTALAEIVMPGIIIITAGGFASDDRFNLAVTYSRVMFPYIFFISLASFFGGILNSMNKFSASAAGPVLLNLFMIGALLYAYYFDKNFGTALIYSVPLAGVAQLAFVWIAYKSLPYKLSLKRPKISPEMRNLVKIALPAALAGGVVQINLIVGRQIASFFDGAIAWLSYADRLYQLPLGVVGIALGTVLLPTLSKKISKNDEAERDFIVNRSVELALVLTLPATLVFIILPQTIVSVLFQRGAFSVIDTFATANALSIYALGLPAFVLQKIVITRYFSKGNTSTPFKFAILGMITNVLVALLLIPLFGYLAPAIGTSVSGWVMTLFLCFGSHKYRIKVDYQLMITTLKIVVATAMMSICILIFSGAFGSPNEEEKMPYIVFFIMVFVGALTYLISLKLLGFFKNLLSDS